MGSAIRTPLLLPERHGFFDSIDRFAACGEGLVPVCRARRDADRHIADRELTGSMSRSDSNAGVVGSDALEHSCHLFFCEAFVRLVVESGNLVSIGMIADDAEEDTDSARSRMLDRSPDFVERDRLIADLT